MAESKSDASGRPGPARRLAPAPGDAVAIGADHAGVALKRKIGELLSDLGFRVLDLGTDSEESVDYPDFAKAVANAVAEDRAQWGVLVCGSGIGMSMAANRNPAVRAALVHDLDSARLSRQHNDANVLALGARVIGEEAARDCVRVFFSTPFEGGRHERRVAKLGSET